MPFERYLRDDDDSSSSSNYNINPSYYPDYSSASACHHNPYQLHQHNTVQFQIPSFMLNGPPTLAPGGGAEVLPVGMLDNGSLASQWLVNNGFAPFHSQPDSWSKPFSDHSSDSIPSHIPPHPSTDVHQFPPPLPQAVPVYPPPPSHAPIPSSSPSVHSPEPSPHFHHPPHQFASTQTFGAPSAGGLPVYSSTGFDLLSILARVVTRPHPKVVLGPIDGSCSFVVSDVRRHDAPIVYASPSFYQLTGYDEHEVIGRNCRFLQAPDGIVHRGEPRRHVAQEAVAHLKKALSADKECQASLVNYRKNGQAFINLVTVIPITGGISNARDEQDEVAYHVGFQVNLTEQPNAILQKLRDGSYIVNYSSTASLPQSLGLSARERRLAGPPSAAVSNDLKTLLLDEKFVSSFPLTTSTNLPVSSSSSDKSDAVDGNQLLNMILLESLPDFILVLSLKGAFLYVAPSVRLSLGYEADELVGKNMDEFCHQGDKVRLERELKESSVLPSETGVSARAVPRPVDAVFRARSKAGPYVWVECRGRLHVEPGKGRKAIILSARVKPMAKLLWGSIAQGGGLAYAQDMRGYERPSEVWGMANSQGTLTVVGAGAEQVLGWKPEEMMGRELQSFVTGTGNVQKELLREQPCPVVCNMRRKDGSLVLVQIVIYRLDGDDSSSSGNRFVWQIKETGAFVRNDLPDFGADVFEGLEATRDSAWHYELEQLRKNYDRLASEVQSLEASSLRRDSHVEGSSATPPPPPPSTAFSLPKEWRGPGHKRSWAGEDGPS